ncbi:MAG: hypothetical protein OXD31_08210 [Chloroflexi bacterium]|nr:hypothetical protein [Chloroflexota bacterium]
MHRTAPRFWRYFDQLPESTQRVARRNFDLLKSNPRHPSLNFKKVGKYWSVRVGLGYRALAVEDDDGFVWVWIGLHNEYDRLTN